jgi:hypothetical protein
VRGGADVLVDPDRVRVARAMSHHSRYRAPREEQQAVQIDAKVDKAMPTRVDRFAHADDRAPLRSVNDGVPASGEPGALVVEVIPPSLATAVTVGDHVGAVGSGLHR